MPSIDVTHNMEMGHRLSKQPDSKCYQLHGHSWWVTLWINGPMDLGSNMLANLNFGDVKKLWRGWLDAQFDHHLLLNPDDPLVRLVQTSALAKEWGITLTDHGDPTVENVARILYEGAKKMFDTRPQVPLKFHVHVKEASTNGASYGDGPF